MSGTNKRKKRGKGERNGTSRSVKSLINIFGYFAKESFLDISRLK